MALGQAVLPLGLTAWPGEGKVEPGLEGSAASCALGEQAGYTPQVCRGARRDDKGTHASVARLLMSSEDACDRSCGHTRSLQGPHSCKLQFDALHYWHSKSTCGGGGYSLYACQTEGTEDVLQG